VKNRPQRQLSQGELSAYQMGLELAGQANTRSRRRRRREVQVRDHELVIIEEDIYEEESYWER
jgi:hypothetical protein